LPRLDVSIPLGQGCALPTELFPQKNHILTVALLLSPCQGWMCRSLWGKVVLYFPELFPQKHFFSNAIANVGQKNELCKLFAKKIQKKR